MNANTPSQNGSENFMSLISMIATLTLFIIKMVALPDMEWIIVVLPIVAVAVLRFLAILVTFLIIIGISFFISVTNRKHQQ